mgnify:CR=1 FL=1
MAQPHLIYSIPLFQLYVAKFIPLELRPCELLPQTYTCYLVIPLELSKHSCAIHYFLNNYVGRQVKINI